MVKAKKILITVKLEIGAGKATPAPPVGSKLGKYGIKLPAFCQEFNDRSSGIEIGAPVPTLVTIYQDKSFSFILKTLPTSYLLRKNATSHKSKLYINTASLCSVYEVKKGDMTAYTKEAGLKTILGTALSMGIQLKDSEA